MDTRQTPNVVLVDSMKHMGTRQSSKMVLVDSTGHVVDPRYNNRTFLNSSRSLPYNHVPQNEMPPLPEKKVTVSVNGMKVNVRILDTVDDGTASRRTSFRPSSTYEFGGVRYEVLRAVRKNSRDCGEVNNPKTAVMAIKKAKRQLEHLVVEEVHES